MTRHRPLPDRPDGIPADHGATGPRPPYGAVEQPAAAGRFHGLHVPDPAFADDTGGADPALAAALAAHAAAAAPGPGYAVVTALLPTRLLVPVVAVLDEAVDATPAAGEKDSHMASVSLVGRDGRRALLAFTGLAALTAWDPAARPVPARAPEVALAALEEGADAVLLDVAGPVPFPVEGPALRALAERRPWRPPYDDPDVHAAVAAALTPLTAAGRVRLAVLPAADADLVVALEVDGDVTDAQARDLAGAASRLLAGDPVLRSRLVRGLSLSVARS